MELSHLLTLVSELTPNTTLYYVRGSDTCKFVDIDIEGQRINSVAPNGEDKSWAPTYLAELAPKIYENEPFNLSGLLNNRGSYRPVLETIIAHTREFYTVRRGTATALVWIPSKPKEALELIEIAPDDIPPSKHHDSVISKISKDKLAEELRNGFITYFSNYLRLSTGKCEEAKIEQYLNLYEKTVAKPLHEKFPEFRSIFEYENVTDLNNFFFQAKSVLPQMEILLLDKWPQEKEKQTLYYEPWTMIRHYKVFLDLLKSFNVLASSIKPTSKSFERTKLHDVDQQLYNYLRAMRTKPFLLLAGISGTGKSRIVKQMAFDSCPDNKILREDATTPGNYCLVEVKPNWHDSSELIGYASQIGSPHYEVTSFVRFLAKAMLYEEQRVPFFVCLDEMNLAPVEQYFAEFLSVLESRKVVNGRITSEALIPDEVFAKYEEQLKKDLFGIQQKEVGVTYQPSGTSDPEAHYGTENAVYNRLKNEGMRIPSNLIVIGTVNMDETTHQFSRKVIDRAMTIEMNLPEGEPFLDFFNNTRDLEYNDTPFPADLFLPSIVKAADAVEALAEDNAEKTEWLKKEVATILTDLNAALEDTPFKIAYRVQNELMLYFCELWKENKATEWSDILNESVDQILMMKVLPRVEGDEDLLEKPLASLANFCAMGNYRKAAQKVAEMKNRLDRAHFTSYWP